MINDAQCPERERLWRFQQCARVEADEGFARDKRIGGKARVLCRVWDDKQALFGLEDRVGTDGDLARGRALAQANLSLEPLTGRIDKANQSDGCVADVRCNLGNVVEWGLRRGIQDAVVAQRREPVRLAPGWTRCDWGLVPGEG